MKALAGWVLRRLLLGFVDGRRLVVSLGHHKVLPVGVLAVSPNVPFSQGHQSYAVGYTPVTSFSLNHLFRDAVSKYSHILKDWR